MKNDGPPLYYKRKIFEHEDPSFAGSFAVDFISQPFTEKDDTLPIRTTYFSENEFNDIGSNDTRPMLIILHGLSGGSYEIYLKHVLAPLVGAKGEKQWEACVINSRGCAMHKITSSILFNARATWDIRQTVLWLRKKFPNRPLFGAGYVLLPFHSISKLALFVVLFDTQGPVICCLNLRLGILRSCKQHRSFMFCSEC